MSDPAIVGEAVAETITNAIETAQNEEQMAHETAEMIAAAALETERGARIEAVERRFDQWESSQSDTSEAIAALTLGMVELSAKVDLLTQQSLPTPSHQSEADGQKESQEPETPIVVVEAEAETPAEPPAQEQPKKKRRSWI